MRTNRHLALAAALLLALPFPACRASADPTADAPKAKSADEQRRGGFGGSALTTHEFLEVKQGLPPAAVPAAGTVNGTGIDREDYKSALVTCAVSALTAGTSITVNVDESDVVGSGYTAVSGATFIAFTPARAGTPQVFYGNLDLRGRKQFLRLTEVTVGTFTTSFRSCNFTLAGPAVAPNAWVVTTPDFNVR